MTYFNMTDFTQNLRQVQIIAREILFLGFILLGLMPLVEAAEMPSTNVAVVENIDTGQINWTTGVIRSQSSQPPLLNAYDADSDKKQFSLAKSQAQQQMLTTIKNIRIGSNHLVDQVLGNIQIMAELQTLIVETPFIEREYLSDRTVRVTLAIPLHGAVSQLLLPREIHPIQPIATYLALGEAIAAPDPYTGLIVDTRAFDVHPMLVPEIVDDTGTPVYGTAFVSREFVVSRGMVSYVRQPDSVGFDDRVGDNPLIIHGLKLADNGNDAIVVSSGEAAKVREASAHLEFLRQCRVIIWVK